MSVSSTNPAGSLNHAEADSSLCAGVVMERNNTAITAPNACARVNGPLKAVTTSAKNNGPAALSTIRLNDTPDASRKIRHDAPTNKGAAEPLAATETATQAIEKNIFARASMPLMNPLSLTHMSMWSCIYLRFFPFRSRKK